MFSLAISLFTLLLGNDITFNFNEIFLIGICPELYLLFT